MLLALEGTIRFLYASHWAYTRDCGPEIHTQNSSCVTTSAAFAWDEFPRYSKQFLLGCFIHSLACRILMEKSRWFYPILAIEAAAIHDENSRACIQQISGVCRPVSGLVRLWRWHGNGSSLDAQRSAAEGMGSRLERPRITWLHNFCRIHSRKRMGRLVLGQVWSQVGSHSVWADILVWRILQRGQLQLYCVRNFTVCDGDR
jgi:hypothetical protein